MLPAVLAAAPLVMAGATFIGSLFSNHKNKKKMQAATAQLNAQTAQGAAQLNAMMGGALGATGASYMTPSGIQPGAGGIRSAGPLPGFV